MEDNKLDFQDLSNNLEDELVDYKNDFPKNIGAALTNFLPIGFGLYGLVALGFGINAGNRNLLFLGVIFFTISGYMRFMYGKDKKEDPSIPLNIWSLTDQLYKRFGKYPDVKNYLKDFDAEYSRVKQKKTTAQKIVNAISAVVFFGALIILAMIAL